MEVDLNPSTSTVESRHTSPFLVAFAGPSTSTTPSPSTSSGQITHRKRRRSAQPLSGPLSPSLDVIYGFHGERRGDVFVADHDGSDTERARIVSICDGAVS